MAEKKDSKATFNYGGVKLSLTKSKTKGAVQFGKKPAARGADAPSQDLEGFEVFNANTDLDQKLDDLRAQPEVSVGTHVWHVDDGDDDYPLIPTGNLYIEFKPGTDDEKQRELLDEFDLNLMEVVGPDAYRVAVTPTSPNPIKCVMLLQKKKIVQIAEPEFVTKPVTNDFSQPDGQFFATQWHLENNGTAIPIVDIPNAVYGASHFKKGADAKVKEAWKFLGNMGSGSIKIAVIDTGFATDHPQLRGDGTKIRNAFNAAERHNDVSPLFRAADGSWGVFSHGTSCAAVAAGAPDMGIIGAAPNSRIIPIKLDILSDTAIKSAFEHALLNGADIISCSLGFPKPVPLSTFITNYLTKVASEGRGGKGLPMFFAAGNANPASNNVPREISDFAAHPESICVTASNSLDEPSDYSFFGRNAFLSAPTNGNDGVGITTASVDVDGSGNILLTRTSGFGGTSSATPLAAGICALMLTANPNLTLSQIKSILSQSTDKIAGGYNGNGHSPNLGYGRINALKAVKMAAGGGGSAPAPSTTPAGGATSSTSAAQRGEVTSQSLNVRSGPGTSNPKVGQLKQGDIVNLFERVSGWWRIGNQQYVSGGYIQVLTSNNAPVTTREGKVTSTTLNVRSGPGTGNPKVAQLKKGATVTIFETSSNGWHRIGDKQWVAGSYIQEM